MIEKNCGRSCVCRNKQKKNQDLKTYQLLSPKKKKMSSTKTLVFHKINRRGCSWTKNVVIHPNLLFLLI